MYTLFTKSQSNYYSYISYSCINYRNIYWYVFLWISINLLKPIWFSVIHGIVVDDAIIVIENVERILHSNKTITVKEATYEAMSEITRPVIAIVLVLCAVFIIVSFMGGFRSYVSTICYYYSYFCCNLWICSFNINSCFMFNLY